VYAIHLDTVLELLP